MTAGELAIHRFLDGQISMGETAQRLMAEYHGDVDAAMVLVSVHLVGDSGPGVEQWRRELVGAVRPVKAGRVIGVIQRYGKSRVERTESRDISVRAVHLTDGGPAIEADLLSTGRGSVSIERLSGGEWDKVRIILEPIDAPMADRVKVYIGHRFYSVSELAEALGEDLS